jgi:hypothetical protein
MLPVYSLTDPSVLVFIVLPIALAAAITAGIWYAWRRSGEPAAVAARAAALMAAGCAGWMAITWIVADRGTFREWDRVPPSLAMLAALIVIVSARLAMGGAGRRLAAHIPLWMLVAVQGFRLPLELAMHRMFERGIMPEQMSYSGRNFDIVTGATALIVAALVATDRGGRLLVAAWNAIGLALLLNIVIVAIVSTPMFALFGPERLNTWVTYPPFIWLPAVMVLAALTGHLIIFRALGHRRDPRADAGRQGIGIAH